MNLALTAGTSGTCSMKEPRQIIAFLLLLVAAIAGDYFAIPIFFGFDFLFGSIAVMLVLYLYGTTAGVVVAALASISTYFAWGHPYGVIIFTTEALFVGLLLRRLPGNFLLVDAAFWPLIGLPMAWIFYSSLLNWDTAAWQLVILKQSLNGIYSSLVANFLVFFAPLRRWAKLPQDERTHPFGQILANVLASFLLLPALVFLIIYGRQELGKIQGDVKNLLLTSATNMRRDLVTWHAQYLHAVEQVGGAATRLGIAQSRELQHDLEVIHKALPDFRTMFVADANGTTVAFSPAVGESGQSTIGLNFSDRNYFEKLKNSRQPIMTEVFLARGGISAPIVALGVPLHKNGRFVGFVMGAIDLGKVGTLLKHNSEGENIQVTLLDQTGRVVTSTDDRWTTLHKFAREERRDLLHLGDSVYQSFPENKALPDILLWKKSYFIRRSNVAADMPWILVSTVSARSYVEHLQQSYIKVLAFTLGLITLGLLLSQVLSLLMTRPLSGLATLTSQLPERIRSGLQNGWPRSRVKEVSFLIDNFRKMARVLSENFDALALSKDSLSEQAQMLSKLNGTLRKEITERKQAEDSVRKSQEQLRLQATALLSAANAIVITDPNGVIEWVNPAFTTLTDYTFEEAVGKNPRMLKSGRQDNSFYRDLWSTISSGKVWHQEMTNRRKDGSLYTEEQKIAPVIGSDGKISHFVSIKQDITERKLVETKLRQNMDELEKANRVKNEFLGVMSHELRTPLNVIMGYGQMVQDGAFGAINQAQSHALEKVKRQSMELLGMVDSILAVTKIDADKMSIERDVIDLASFFNTLKEETNTQQNKNVTMSWDFLPDLPPLITDVNKLKHILQNLINNALKFTDEGHIWVSVKHLREKEKLAIEVCDTGIGIAEQDLAVIFDKFRQVDSSAIRNYGGAGLGLYIVKKYTELLGGTVQAESEPGKGSTFTVTLPYACDLHASSNFADLVARREPVTLACN
jgi:PAS domain S-box-containing protein